MATTNILLNKTATASSCILPFSANRVNNGNSTDPISRWMASLDTPPAWVTVDAGASFFVNRWVAKFMGGAGWATLGNYNPTSFSFYSSMDNSTWTLRDAVTSNTSSSVDRTLAVGFSARYFRIVVSAGPAINTKLASVVEFEVYNASGTTLSNLTLSASAINPTFNSATLAYTATVPFATTSTTVTPTVFDPNSTVTVNGTAVVSGQASGAINLNVGTNTITVVVSQAGIASTTYTITVTRLDSSYLTALTAQSGTTAIALSPTPFVKTTMGYIANVGYGISSITVTPTAESTTASITVNGSPIISGQASVALPLSIGQNSIAVVVTASGVSQTYTITITRVDTSLSGLTGSLVPSGTFTINPSFLSTTFIYTASSAKASIKLVPTASNANSVINVNGTQVTSGASTTVSLVVGSNTVLITVTNSGVTTIYQITVTR